MFEHMDLFSRATLNVNGSQDGACRWQQPLANCDTERERLRVGVGETYSTFSRAINVEMKSLSSQMLNFDARHFKENFKDYRNIACLSMCPQFKACIALRCNHNLPRSFS